jgi:DNA-directed RNA polymerase subunit beta'
MLSQTENSLTVRNSGKIEFDTIRTVDGTDNDGKAVKVVVSRTGEIRVIDPKNNRVLSSSYIPYGAYLFVTDGQEVQRGDKVCGMGSVQRGDCKRLRRCGSFATI